MGAGLPPCFKHGGSITFFMAVKSEAFPGSSSINSTPDMCPSTKKLFKIALFLLFLSLVTALLTSFYLFSEEDERLALPDDRDGGQQDDDYVLIDRSHEKKPIFLPPEGPTDLPIIVWWTDFVPEMRDIRRCKEGSCLITKSRTELQNPDVSAFMYYGTDVDWNDLPLPRKPQHMWALLHEESPKNNWVLATEKGIELFNFTATCSRYSSYPLHLHFFHSVERLMQPIRYPTQLKSRGSLGQVIFMQSDCDPPSDRDSYIEELMKYIDVDSYGRCLHNKDLPEELQNPLTFNSEGVMNIVGKYKFAIAFENAICNDYITEKFWRPLYAGVVPIVRGSPTVKDWAPSEKSIIVAEDFPTPKDLADYLKFLDGNDAEYEKYLTWKMEGVTNKRLLADYNSREWFIENDGLSFIDGFQCYVCDQLHIRRRQNIKSPLIADKSHYDCPMAEPALKHTGHTLQERMSKLRQEARSELGFWRRHAKCSERKAGIISKLISQGATQQQVTEATKNACLDIPWSDSD